MSVVPIEEIRRGKEWLADLSDDGGTLWDEFSADAREALPEFCRLIRYFSDHAGTIVRNMNGTRSPLEIECLNGFEDHHLDKFADFFGPPAKAPGRHLSPRLSGDTIIRRLGGAYLEQTVYIRQFSSGVRLYAAVWPWHIHPGVVTLHFGIDLAAPSEEHTRIFQRFVHAIPA